MLEIAEGFYFYKTLPIRWVRITGIVSAIDTFEGHRAYTIDDSSNASIEALLKIDGSGKPIATKQYADQTWTASVADGVTVGSIVDVKGWLHTFNDLQINIKKMELVHSTTDELKLWRQREEQQQKLLDKPWVLQKREIRRCRAVAEKSEAEATRDAQRIQKAVEAANKSTKGRKNEPKKDESNEENLEQRERAEQRRAAIARGIAEGKFKALGL